jgi:hypothetical protein
MTDAQMMTLALAIIIPLSLLIYSNSRITDAKDTLRAEIKALQMEIKALQVEMQAGFARIAADIKALDTKIETKFTIHELEHHR